MFEGDDYRFGWFSRLFPLVMILLAVACSESSPNKSPANAAVFGCYAAAAGPPILLDAAGMHVKQLGFPAIRYHLERLKTGIALTADAPIRADKVPTGYRFGMNERGIGRFMPFYRVENGQTYGVFEVDQLEGFQLLASDGTYIDYDHAEPTRCS